MSTWRRRLGLCAGWSDPAPAAVGPAYIRRTSRNPLDLPIRWTPDRGSCGSNACGWGPAAQRLRTRLTTALHSRWVAYTVGLTRTSVGQARTVDLNLRTDLNART